MRGVVQNGRNACFLVRGPGRKKENGVEGRKESIDDYIRLSINDTISKRQIVESIGTKHASKYNKLN